MSTLYTAIVFVTAFSMIIMMVAVHGNSFMSLVRKRGFLLLFSLLAVANLAEWLAASLDGIFVSLRALHIFAKFVELSIAPVIPVVCASAIGGDRNVRLMSIPIGINVVLQVVSLFTGVVFSVDAASIYHRGYLYALYVATFVCGFVFLFVHCVRFSRRYQNHNALLLVLIMSLGFIAMVLPIVNRTIRLDWTCASLAAIFVYVYYDGLTEQMDGLTTLLSRKSYDCYLQSLHEPTTLLFFDVDRFKEVNDTYGHQFGDVCLTRLAAIVRDVFEAHGYCYRFGGDEFCAILTDGTSDVEGLITAFTGRLEEARIDEPRLPRVSVGYARFEPSEEVVEEALRRADAMMYEYKQKRHAEMDGIL